MEGASYQTISLWFKTTTADGVLFSYQAAALRPGSTTANYMPALYIGSDGKLNAEFWDGTPRRHDLLARRRRQLAPGYADRRREHPDAVPGRRAGRFAVRQGQVPEGQQLRGRRIPRRPLARRADYNQGSSTGSAMYFTGHISDVAFWTRPLTAAEVQAMYAAGTHPAALLTKVTRPVGQRVRAGVL